MMRAIYLMWLLALLVMTGCVSSATGTAASRIKPAATPTKEYRIQPGDQLDVKFFYNPELNEQLTVRSDGRITLQLVNDVVAAGLTPAELTSMLTRAYAGELSNPKIAVIVRNSIADRVYVDGEVYRAGLVNLIGPTTVLQSIAQAGGMKESARIAEVLLLRKGDDNKTGVYKLNLKDALNGEDVSQDVLLRPNDIIFVPRSRIGNVNVWVDQYLRKNIPLPLGLGYTIQ